MVINPSEFGIDVKQAEQVSNSFAPKIAEIEGYQNVYSGIIQSELNKETMHQARELRLRLVKVRTGIAAIHKSEKAFYLAAGRFVDALKNKLTEPVEQMEEKLLEIEETEKRLEAERIARVKAERESELSKYCENVSLFPLGEMTQEAYEQLLNGQILAYEAKKKAEEEAEIARIEKERKEALHNQRKENLIDVWQFVDEETRLLNYGEVSEDEYNTIVSDALLAKDKYESEQAAIRAENERLKKEAEEKEAALAAERKAAQEQADKERKEAEAKLAEERRIAAEKLKAEQAEKAKLEKELTDKKAAEEKAEAERLAAIEAEAAKGDAERFSDYIGAIEAVMKDAKFNFKSKKFKDAHSKGQELLEKTIIYLNGRK